MSSPRRAIVTLILSLLIVGCVSHRSRVDCEGHLRAINAPAPAKPAGVHP